MALLYHPRYKKVRESLLRYRLEAGLTQLKLAEHLKTSQSFVSKVENGERYLDVLEFITWCECCKKSPEEAIAEIK